MDHPRHQRSPHASVDTGSRVFKALKIELLLGRHLAGPIRLLEIGTGSGVIANHFGSRPGSHIDVSSVDVVDIRTVTEGYDFILVSETRLPFEPAVFDVVISNHVIEHVGDSDAQKNHLTEIARVLKPAGVGYLAAPNRWAVIEPHFRMPFLSWMPPSLRTPYLRLARKGRFYDCSPLSKRQLERLMVEAGLSFEHVEVEAIQLARSVEDGAMIAMGSRLPKRLVEYLTPLLPTFVCRIWPERPAA